MRRVYGSSLSTTTPPVEPIYSNTTAGTAKNTFTAEAQINDVAGMGQVAQLNSPALWGPGSTASKATLRVVSRGIVSTVATAPTFTWTTRFGTSTAGALLLGSPAISTTVVTNSPWEAEGDIQPVILAATGANSTFRGMGFIQGPGAFVSPFQYPYWAGAASPGTVATVDWSVSNPIWYGVACGTSSASNGITLLQLVILGF